MMLNKNISIWRGYNAPPTLNHLWVDETNNIKININNEWVSLFDSNLKEFLLEYMNNKEYETLKRELQFYIDNKELDLIEYNNVDLTNLDALLSIRDSLEKSETYLARLTTVNDEHKELFEDQDNVKLKEDQTAFFYKEFIEYEDTSDLNISQESFKLSNSEEQHYYHLIFGYPSDYKTYAIEDINGVCKTRNPEQKPTQLWAIYKNLGDVYYFKNKNNKYLDWDGTRFITSDKLSTDFRIVKSNNGDKNYYTLERSTGTLMNCFQGLGYNREVREWDDLNDVNSQIGIVQFKDPFFSSNFTELVYCIHFADTSNGNFVLGEASNNHPQVLNSPTHEDVSYWKFIGDNTNFQIQNYKSKNYIKWNNTNYIMSSSKDDYGFTLYFSYKNNKQYYQISWKGHTDGRALKPYIFESGRDLIQGESQLAMNCLNFNLVKKNTLRCNTLDFTNCFRNYPIIRSKAVEVTLFPNTFYIWGVTDQLNITLGEEIEDITSEYLFQFTSGETPTKLNLPDNIKWANGQFPDIKADMVYQISILNGLGSIIEFY